jgi:hypothetical protein
VVVAGEEVDAILTLYFARWWDVVVGLEWMGLELVEVEGR